MSKTEDQARDEQAAPAPEPHAAASEEIGDLQRIWKRHGVPVLAAICIGALLGGGITYFRQARGRRLQAAGAELFELRTAQAIQDWMSRYARTPAAPLGAFRLADTFFSEARYGDALNVYEAFAADYPRHLLAIPAAMGRCQALEALGRFQDALTAYETFAASHPDHFLRPEALLGQARCLRQLHRPDEAQRVYEDIMVQFPDSMWALRAEEGILYIERADALAAAAPAMPAVPAMPGWADLSTLVSQPETGEAAVAPVEAPAAEPLGEEVTADDDGGADGDTDNAEPSE